jgi:large subunit ribosomal protein L28
MSKICELTGKKPVAGNKVSHANNKTKRRFLPNLQNMSFRSDKLDKVIKLKVATSTLRSVEKSGGIDNFLIKAKVDGLSKKALAYKLAIAS